MEGWTLPCGGRWATRHPTRTQALPTHDAHPLDVSAQLAGWATGSEGKGLAEATFSAAGTQTQGPPALGASTTPARLSPSFLSSSPSGQNGPGKST